MMRAEARFRRLMSVLGDPSRWAITHVLQGGGRCVTDLAHEIGLSQSCTTRHLQVLERERVVRGARAGKRVIYSLREDDTQLAGLLGMGRPDATGSRPRPRRVPKPMNSGAAIPTEAPSRVANEPAETSEVLETPQVRGRVVSDIEDWLL